MSSPPRVIDHVTLTVGDLDASRRFYQEALRPLGFNLLYEKHGGAAFGAEEADDFAIRRGSPSGPIHLAFASPTREAVDQFYRYALRAGGRDNGGPGLRPLYHDTYYAAYVLDPDGNNIEAVNHGR